MVNASFQWAIWGLDGIFVKRATKLYCTERVLTIAHIPCKNIYLYRDRVEADDLNILCPSPPQIPKATEGNNPLLTVSWSHIPNTTIVSDTSTMPENDMSHV